jgi:uncharacterized protein involved in response to NO
MTQRPIPISIAEPKSASAGAKGHPFWSGAFRPLFLLGGLQALIGVVWWVAAMVHDIPVPAMGTPALWHAHELLFGFGGAAVGGFLLTAIANWTGRPPVRGGELICLTALWLLARIACGFAADLPIGVLIIGALGYFLVLIAIATRELILGKNRRNLKIIAILGLLAVLDIVYILAAMGVIADLSAEISRGAIFVFALLIAIIGGRVIPAFTRNWLIRQGKITAPDQPGGPVMFGRFDAICILALVVAALLSVTVGGMIGGVALILCGILHLIRLVRWRGIRAHADPLVWMLHAAYLWLPIGFVILGIAAWQPDLYTTKDGLHALTAGAIACMVMAVGGRAALGHTGRPLKAGWMLTAAFCAVWLAALMRIAAPLDDYAFYLPLLKGATLAWVGGWVLFLIRYAPILIGPRKKA